eukprot:gene9654-9814_t
MADAIKAQRASVSARVSRNVQRCSRLHVVASTVSGTPPPAWNKRVVVPEVEPRDSPKVRQFKPKMVAIRDASKVKQLQELIKDVSPQPEILVGDEGAVEVARHPEIEAVVTGIVGIILTASGGAFRDWPVEKLSEVTVEQAITHPNWSMGKKITIDSATLMNKGLEVIEAHYLYGVDYDNIEIVIHPQSIIHSMIETADSSVLAQLGWPDMRLPIMYTMSWPERIATSNATWPRLDFSKANSLTFKQPDHEKYPSMELAYAAGRAGGTMTGVLSAANEQAVQMFIDHQIGYLDIMKLNAACCEAHQQELILTPNLEEIVHYDQWARRWAAAEYLDAVACGWAIICSVRDVSQ